MGSVFVLSSQQSNPYIIYASHLRALYAAVMYIYVAGYTEQRLTPFPFSIFAYFFEFTEMFFLL